MPKTKISEWSSTPANNTDIDSINIAEGCAPSGINDAIREMMAQVKDLYAGTSGDTIAVAGGGTGVGTLTGIVKGNGTSAFTAVTAPTGAIVGTTDTQTLTNKTLTAPTIASANLTTALTLTGSAGTSGQVLTSGGSGAAPTWATSGSPSGSVIQVANLASQSVFSTTETTTQQGPQTSTFTLLSNSSKVMVIANFALYGVAGSSGLVYIYSSIYRGSIASGTRLNSTLVIDSKGSMAGQYVGSGGEMYQYVTLTYLDTPTASTTYSIGYTKHAGTGQSNAYIQGCNITLMEISV
jgi:hypothetical protein